MATQLKIRRGTTAEHASFTGAEGEITLDTTKDTLVAHDNYTAGGRPMLREDLSNLANSSIGVGKIDYGSAAAFQSLRVNSAGNGVEFGTSQAYMSVISSTTGTDSGWCTRWNTIVESSNMTMSANTYMVISIPGTYFFTFATISPNSTTNYEMNIGKSGESYSANNGRSYSNVSGHSWLTVDRVMYCAAGTQVGLQSAGSTYVYASGHGWFRGMRISD